MKTAAAGLAALLLLAADVAAPAGDCAPQDRMTFLCGIDAAEDVAAIPGTSWLLASGLRLGSPATIKLVDTASGRVTAAYPHGAADRPDRGNYHDCPGPPDAQRLSTSGVALQRLDGQRHLFYAVNSEGRRGIEVFEVDAAAATPALSWVGCILMPPGTNPNAVTPLEGRGIAIVSMDDGSPDRMARHVAGAALGTVWEWDADRGLRQLPGIRLRGGNGIVASQDLQWLYVSAWSGAQIVRIRRDGSVPVQAFDLPWLPDNLKRAADGSILVAAQRPPAATIANCTGDPCPADWVIARLDPQSLEYRVLFEARGTTAVNYATGVTESGGTLFVTNRGRARIGVLRTVDR